MKITEVCIIQSQQCTSLGLDRSGLSLSMLVSNNQFRLRLSMLVSMLALETRGSGFQPPVSIPASTTTNELPSLQLRYQLRHRQTSVIECRSELFSFIIMSFVAPVHQSRHGERIARKSRRFAASSPRNSSLAGSHFKERCNLYAMIVRCPSDADR